MHNCNNRANKNHNVANTTQALKSKAIFAESMLSCTCVAINIMSEPPQAWNQRS